MDRFSASCEKEDDGKMMKQRFARTKWVCLAETAGFDTL
jgi:hypothetical protein